MKPARMLSAEEKRDIVLALLAGNVGMAELCRRHQVTSTSIYNWRREFIESGLRGLKGEGPSDRERAMERENLELKELIGDLAVVNLRVPSSQSLRRPSSFPFEASAS